ncbi:MAG: sorbosone dehydrogenase family protein [Cytophagales bacterium]|nr:sorbosone dehydrogenase family protein [Armatimonadota bacterium]
MSAPAASLGKTLTGEAAKGDWSTDAPGLRRKLTTADLPPPYSTDSANNGPGRVPQPEGALPKVPAGFTVKRWAGDLRNPRVLATAPNGDIFVAESQANRISVLRDADGDGTPETQQVFFGGREAMPKPFGIGFYPLGKNPKWVYVACTDRVVRLPYQNGDLVSAGKLETIVDTIPGYGQLRGGGHWTRDLDFSRDGKTMFVSVGSRTNVDERNEESERLRALIYAFTPDGKNGRVYASGIRNPVGLAVQPGTGTLWTSVNERDGLGDHLVPDYITSVKEDGFYGWPWYYLGPNQDPRHPGAHPELKNKAIVPDVLLQSHMASLDLAFYTGKQFPKEYQGSLFACEHGSWNRSRRTGYKVIRAILKDGKATGEYEDFVTGFVVNDGNVWGRPVGLTTAGDGSLLFSDDGSNSIWRVTYTGNKSRRVAEADPQKTVSKPQPKS